MNYTGQFKNINNTLYQIDIDINNGITGSTEIVLAGEPFKVEYNSNGLIYEPLKLSNATCSILSNTYLFDIYSSTAQGTKLTLKNIDSNTIEWVGYITPNIYTQAFEQPIDQIDLEAIDGLSTLDNYKYETIDPDNKKIKSFEEILIHIIAKCNCYSNIYINQNNSLTGSTDIELIDKLFIAEQNFYNDDSQPATDTTAAVTETSMTYKEVLSELIQFLGYTITAVGNSVYILDYDYLKNGFINYNQYTTSNNWLTYSINTIQLNDIHNITANSFKKNGGTIELDATYNQVSIKTDLNKKDSLLPDFFDVNFLTNIVDDNNNLWNNTLWQINGDSVYVSKFFANNQYQYYWYDNDTNWNNITLGKAVTPDNLCKNIGAIVTMQGNYKYDNGIIPSTISYSNYIQLVRHLQANPTSTQNVLKPVLKNVVGTIPETSSLFDDLYYIIISGSGLFDDIPFDFYYHKDNGAPTSTDQSDNQLYITAKLKIGNKYWNNTIWTTADSTFKIYFDKGTETDETKLVNRWFDINNTLVYGDMIDSKGQKIRIKSSDQLLGDVEFTLYTPQNNIMPSRRIDVVFLKDFDVKIVKQNLEKNNDTNTQYLNAINTNYVNQFSDMSMKVCSQTNKGMNYSSVIELNDNGIYAYNQFITNKALNKTQLQEYNIIEKYVNQYSNPMKKLNITLGNNYKPYTLFTINYWPDEKYIVDKMSIDYYNDNNLLTIIEKF